MDEISIVITTYNEDQDTLEATIDSVLSQIGVSVSLFVSSVVDDRNFRFLSEYPNIVPIFSTKEEHPGYGPQGSFYQLNKAIKEINPPEYFCFFSGNDIMLPNYASMCIDALKDNGKEVAYTKFVSMKNNRTVRQACLYPYSREAHQLGNVIPDTAIITKKMMSLLPFRSSQFGNLAFWDFWLRIYETYGDVFHHIPVIGWKYFLKNTSMHLNREVAWQKQRAIDQKKMLKFHPL